MAPKLNRLERVLRTLAETLARYQVQWALVGGLAVSVRTEPRFTRDVDVAVAVSSDREAEELVAALQRAGFRVLEALEQEAVGRLAAVRLQPPGEPHPGLVVDLLFASSGIEPELVARAEALPVFPHVVAAVASLGDLLALKLLSRDDLTRPQDAADLRLLLSFATPEDLRIARQAVQDIQARGFHRGRDLHKDFNALLEKHGIPFPLET